MIFDCWRRPTLLRAAPVVLTLALLAAAPAARAEELHWEPFTADTYREAVRGDIPFVIEFTAEWCKPCNEMKERTFKDPAVIEAGEGFRFLRVDMTKPSPEIRSYKDSFKVPGAPTLLFFDAEATERHRRIGFIPPEEFADMLRDTSAPEPVELEGA